MTPDAPDWEGQTMLDRAGKKVGTIEAIYLVEETGRPEWALVSVSRRRTTLVPLAGARAGADGVARRIPQGDRGRRAGRRQRRALTATGHRDLPPLRHRLRRQRTADGGTV